MVHIYIHNGDGVSDLAGLAMARPILVTCVGVHEYVSSSTNVQERMQTKRKHIHYSYKSGSMQRTSVLMVMSAIL